jgi:PHP family Zn ribbon phosphoesterase
MEVCYLRGGCRPGDFGEPAIDEIGSAAKHETQEKVGFDMGKTLNPEKYNMAFCPFCKGNGKLPKTPDGFDVCRKCGGFGFVKKGEETSGEEENK